MWSQESGQKQGTHFVVLETILEVRTRSEGTIVMTCSYVTYVFLKNICHLQKLNISQYVHTIMHTAVLKLPKSIVKSQ